MALLSIPVQVSTESHTRASVILEGRQWTFEFYTNSVDDAWYWDLISDGTTVVISGEGMANGVDLLAKFIALDVPPGQLFVHELDGGLAGRDPDVTAFAEGRAALYYLESTG